MERTRQISSAMERVWTSSSLSWVPEFPLGRKRSVVGCRASRDCCATMPVIRWLFLTESGRSSLKLSRSNGLSSKRSRCVGPPDWNRQITLLALGAKCGRPGRPPMCPRAEAGAERRRFALLLRRDAQGRRCRGRFLREMREAGGCARGADVGGPLPVDAHGAPRGWHRAGIRVLRSKSFHRGLLKGERRDAVAVQDGKLARVPAWACRERIATEEAVRSLGGARKPRIRTIPGAASGPAASAGRTGER